MLKLSENLNMIKSFIKKLFQLTLASIFIIASMFLFVPTSQAISITKTFPKLANYYLDWDLNKEKIEKLAQWDVVIISNAAYSRYPNAVKELKAINPNIVVLVYVVSQEASTFAPSIEEGNFFKDIYN